MMKKLSIKHSVLLPPLTMIVAMMATMRGRRTSKMAIMMVRRTTSMVMTMAMMATMRGRRTSKMAIMMQAATSLSHRVQGAS